MTLKATERQEILKPIKLLSKVKMLFVSLVDKGAIGAPFAIKNDTGEAGHMTGQYVQAIILPNGMKIEDLSELYGEEWLDNVSREKAEKGETVTKYVQLDEDRFVEGSLKAEPIGDTDGQLIVGELKQTAKQDEETIPVHQPMMEVPVAEETVTRPRTFGEMLFQKMDALAASISSSVELCNDRRRRRRQAMDAAKSFTEWLGQALEALDTAEKADEPVGFRERIKKMFTSGNASAWKTEIAIDAIKSGGIEDMDEKAIRDLINEAVPGAVTEALKAHQEAEETKAAAEAEKTEKETLKAEVKALKEEVETLKAAKTAPDDSEKAKKEAAEAEKAEIKAKIQELTEKLEALEHSPNVSTSVSEDATETSAKKDTVEKSDNEVFRSLFFAS